MSERKRTISVFVALILCLTLCIGVWASGEATEETDAEEVIETPAITEESLASEEAPIETDETEKPVSEDAALALDGDTWSYINRDWSGVYGDVNGNGELDVLDAALILSHSWWSGMLHFKALDANGDSCAGDANDAAFILRSVVGLANPYQPETEPTVTPMETALPTKTPAETTLPTKPPVETPLLTTAPIVTPTPQTATPRPWYYPLPDDADSEIEGQWAYPLPIGIKGEIQKYDDNTLYIIYTNNTGEDVTISTEARSYNEDTYMLSVGGTEKWYLRDGEKYVDVLTSREAIKYYYVDFEVINTNRTFKDANDTFSWGTVRNADDTITVTFESSWDKSPTFWATVYFVKDGRIVDYDKNSPQAFFDMQYTYEPSSYKTVYDDYFIVCSVYGYM